MLSRDFVFWEVDVQADFMLPDGKLYVPGAEKLLPNIRKLTNAACRGEVFLVSHGCFHTANDPEFQQFPPHCVKGTPGAQFVPEALAEKVVRVENVPSAKLPDDFTPYQQIVLEKQTFDVFDNVHTAEVLDRLNPTDRATAVANTIALLQPTLCDADGNWTADYVRLRFHATRGT